MQIVHNLLEYQLNTTVATLVLEAKKWKAVTSIKLREFEKEMGREWEKRGRGDGEEEWEERSNGQWLVVEW
uniref:Uncharacterized protein n=1 Tax=Oryza rufipogon TaxID=4529 RepID=A0A0E0MQU0_ORYRU